ncbi:MAG: phosphate signaling complex protein PhoU [Treponema sp.]|jgi:phosphate transport system protein|nr:phosphate signaling complex protein PhoU [Treponema sp.]
MKARGSLYEEINSIRRELSLMSARVAEDLGKALTILRSGDEELVKEVKESGKIVDGLQLKIEDMALVLIATQQPVASDLREMITVFKITASLERIGDFGIHLVKAAAKLSSRPAFRSMERIEHMVETGQEMLKSAFNAYLVKDVNLARQAATLDDKIDGEHKALTEEVLALMKSQPKLVKAAARLLKLSGYMERLGDHITNICEGVIYMIEGRHVELNR